MYKLLTGSEEYAEHIVKMVGADHAIALGSAVITDHHFTRSQTLSVFHMVANCADESSLTDFDWNCWNNRNVTALTEK